MARRVGVEPATIRTWVRPLGLPEEVQDCIAPREKHRVPQGKIDYQTALGVSEQIAEPERQRAVIEQIVEERLPQHIAAEVIRRAAAEPPAGTGPTRAGGRCAAGCAARCSRSTKPGDSPAWERGQSARPNALDCQDCQRTCVSRGTSKQRSGARPVAHG